jgi:hypothetical protein
MKDEIANRKLAQLAKDKGFNIPVRARYSFAVWDSNKWELFLEPIGIYNNSDKAKYGSISAPTLSLLQKWLREVHQLHIEVIPENQDYSTVWHPIVYDIRVPEDTINCGFQNTYEAALESGIKFHLETLEDVH